MRDRSGAARRPDGRRRGLRVVAHDGAGAAGMVEMDVGDEDLLSARGRIRPPRCRPRAREGSRSDRSRSGPARRARPGGRRRQPVPALKAEIDGPDALVDLGRRAARRKIPVPPPTHISPGRDSFRPTLYVHSIALKRRPVDARIMSQEVPTNASCTADQTAFAFRPTSRRSCACTRRGRPLRDVGGAGRTALRRRTRWLDASILRAINAVTGPVFIEGVMPGDAVAVEILEIEPATGVGTPPFPGSGCSTGSMPEPMLERLPIRDGEVIVSERLRIPVRPMIGCLGLAPAQARRRPSHRPCPGPATTISPRSPGATVLFPAQARVDSSRWATCTPQWASTRRPSSPSNARGRRRCGSMCGPGLRWKHPHRDGGPRLRIGLSSARRLRRGAAAGGAPALRAADPGAGPHPARGLHPSSRPRAISPSAAPPERSSWQRNARVMGDRS